MINTDGNLYALRKYEEEQERQEIALEAFENEIDTLGILDDYEALRALYDRIADRYEGYIMPTFEEYIEERL